MISVIVPVYRVEKYISGCIKSIIEQTEKNFELIVVDDGSPDRSSEIAEKLLSDSWLTNYHVIHTENHGVSVARNIGIKAARGEFVIMVDADDILAPCFLEDMEPWKWIILTVTYIPVDFQLWTRKKPVSLHRIIMK